ncbi:hypothetical protein, partial [Rhodoluna sp.]|uniref:hypothetical protein n=1 Tax=Rhodoluna sp. TaxID=1969481 RepID=UPI0025CE00F5
DSAGLVQLAPSLAGLDSIVRRGLVLRQKLTQNRIAALVLTLAAVPLLVSGFANGNSTTTLVYGSVLISLSVAIAALQTRSLKR